MQEASGFSFQTFALSIAAAELGRAILGAGDGGSVRARILIGVPAAVILIFFSVLAAANSARMNSSRFSARCLCGFFALWYLAELVRTAADIQQVCWEQFSSMTFVGLLPLLLWAGWSFEERSLDRISSILWWFVGAGVIICILGLSGQLHWQNLMTKAAFTDPFPDALLYPEYFSFPLLASQKAEAYQEHKTWMTLPLISFAISSGYALGTALLFGAQGSGTAYSGYELLRAWSFGGISRFDAAFLLIWLAAAMLRLCFLVRAVRLLAARLAVRPGGEAAA